jgi:hypothetical protein
MKTISQLETGSDSEGNQQTGGGNRNWKGDKEGEIQSRTSVGPGGVICIGGSPNRRGVIINPVGTTRRKLTLNRSINRPARCDEATGSAGAAGSDRSAHIAVAINVTAINCRAFRMDLDRSISCRITLSSSYESGLPTSVGWYFPSTL